MQEAVFDVIVVGGGGSGLAAAVEMALKNKRPCVIDVHVDPEVRPPSTGTWQLPPTPYKEPIYGKPYIA